MFRRKEISEQEVQLQVTGSLDSETAEQFQKELRSLADGNHRTDIANAGELHGV